MNRSSIIKGFIGHSIKQSFNFLGFSTIGIYQPNPNTDSNDNHYKEWTFTKITESKQQFDIQHFSHQQLQQTQLPRKTKIGINIADEQVLCFPIEVMSSLNHKELRAYIQLDASQRLGLPIEAICCDYTPLGQEINTTTKSIQVYALPVDIANQHIQRITESALQIQPKQITTIIPDSIAKTVYKSSIDETNNKTLSTQTTQISTGIALSFYQ